MLKKILVVEDTRTIAASSSTACASRPVRHPRGRNGQQAIEAVRADLPDLIFMDLKMPS